MSRQVRILLASGAFLLLALGIGGCGASSDETLARVGGSTITKSTFEHWMSVAKAIGPIKARALMHDATPPATLKQSVMGFLIASARTLGEAQEAGIAGADGEATSLLERLRFEQAHRIAASAPSELQGFVFEKPETTADRIWIIKVHLLAEKVAQHWLSVAEQQISQGQIAAYYARHKHQFIAPERRDVAVIQAFHKSTADIARREIESGRDLLSVVQRRDEEPNVGGYKRGLARRGLAHSYELNFFLARPHVLVGPLRAEIYYLFEVTAITPARQRRLAEVQSIIRRKLIEGSQHQLYTATARSSEDQWRRKISCRVNFSVAQCGGTLG